MVRLYRTFFNYIFTGEMKGTKVLTLGAGRAPQHGGYKDVDAPSSYTHAIHMYLRMRDTVNWWAGLSILPTRGLLPAC